MKMKKLVKILSQAAVSLGIVATMVLGTVNEAYAVTNATMAGVDQGMLNAEYWLNEWERDIPLADNATIAKLNIANYAKAGANLTELYYEADTFDGDSLKGKLASFTSPQNLYLNGQPVAESYYAAIRSNIAAGKTSALMNVKYGITVNRTILKDLPYSDMLSDSPTDADWDNLVSTAVFINDPLLCYFTTGDGKYTYVKSTLCSGWIPTSDVAICQSKDEWYMATHPLARLVVTGSEITTEDSAANPEHSAVRLTMGTTLELCDTPGTVDNRVTWYNYVVVLPERDANGNYVRTLATIPMNRDVSIGYLPLTPRNLLNQAFKSLGNRYGWGGSLNSQDCSSFVREVYQCFGLILPRNTSWQAKMNCKIIEMAGMSDLEKETILLSAPAGAIVQFPGHEMLYLGDANGDYYTINAVSSLAVPMGDEYKVVRGRTVVVNGVKSTKRGNGSTWLSNVTRVIIPWQAP